jgi:hypothetical protein
VTRSSGRGDLGDNLPRQIKRVGEADKEDHHRSRGIRIVRVLRWLARLGAVASIGLVLLFLVVERTLPARPEEWLGSLFFHVGISVGMIVAWWREGPGGAITTGSLVVFYAIHLAVSGAFPAGWAWPLFAAPGFLFLICWYLSRKACA